MDEAILEQLRLRYESGQLVVFAGAGVSAGARPRLPTWRELAEKLRDRTRAKGAEPAVLEEIQHYIDASQLINALSAAKLAIGAQDFNWTVDRELDDTGRDVPETALAIAALKPKLKAVLTTNIDRFLERAFQGEWRVVERPTADIAADTRYILKLHGSLRDWDTWVFSRDQYDRAIFGAPLLQDAFGALYRAYSILFVGCSLADDNLDQTLGRVRALSGGQPPMHFALLPKGVPPFRRRLLEEAGVRLLLYENASGDHAEVAQILRSLAQSGLPAAQPAAAQPATSQPATSQPATSQPAMAQPAAAQPAMAQPAAAQPAVAPVPARPPSEPPLSDKLSTTARSARTPARPVRVFFCYATSDEGMLQKLEAQLAPLKREGLIAPWHSGKIDVGTDREREISEHLDAADLVLLLVSASFLASEQEDAQVTRAMALRAAGRTTVVPILLRPADWRSTRFAPLQALPRDERPVTKWANEDEALYEVAQEIRTVVTRLRAAFG